MKQHPDTQSAKEVTSPPQKTPPLSEDVQQPGQGSASQRADQQAKQGEPLSAERQRDRSPKQENL